MTSVLKTIGDNVKRKRELDQITVEEMAARAKMSVQDYMDIEAGIERQDLCWTEEHLTIVKKLVDRKKQRSEIKRKIKRIRRAMQ